jgi:hypothetical protein
MQLVTIRVPHIRTVIVRGKLWARARRTFIRTAGGHGGSLCLSKQRRRNSHSPNESRVIGFLCVPSTGRHPRHVAAFNQGLEEVRFIEDRLPPGQHPNPTTCLTGGLIDLGDRVGLLHARYSLGPGHQHGRLGGLDGASCGNGQRDRSHALIVRDIGDDGEIVVTEAIPTTNELAPNGLAERRPTASTRFSGFLSWAAKDSAV